MTEEKKPELPGYTRMINQKTKAPIHDERGNTFKPMTIKKASQKVFTRVKK